METRNPWHRLKEDSQGIRTPTRVLRNQARLLDEATGGVIRGQVDTKPARNNTTLVAFNACVPTLNNYEVVLFRVRHPVTQYPATLLTEWDQIPPVAYDDDEALETAIVDYCASPNVQKLVTGLFAQAEQAQE